jgi:hypothetical protein
MKSECYYGLLIATGEGLFRDGEARSSCLILAMLAAMRFVSLRLPERLRRFGLVT